MSSTLKNEVSSSDFEVDSHDVQLRSKARVYRAVDNGRVALTVLALAVGVSVIGVSANALSVYESTHLPPDFFLPLWPESFNLNPTYAMIGGSVVVVAANALSLLTSKTQSLRNRAMIHTSASMGAPFFSLVVAIIAMVFYYAVDASTTVDTIQSWTCRFRHVSMQSPPYFGTLCKQSEAGLALSILLVPLELIILAIAGYQTMLARSLTDMPTGRRNKETSPSLS